MSEPDEKISKEDLYLVKDMGLLEDLLECFVAPTEEMVDALDRATHTLEEVFPEMTETACEDNPDVVFNLTPVDELFHD